VSSRLASDIAGASRGLNAPALGLYLLGGSPPPVGSLLKNTALGGTLERIAGDGKDGFYRGASAEAISAFLEKEGGYPRAADFAAHETSWTAPLEGTYLNHRILVLPPNTQGMAQISLLVGTRPRPKRFTPPLRPEPRHHRPVLQDSTACQTPATPDLQRSGPGPANRAGLQKGLG
jgi:hypothetical protein